MPDPAGSSPAGFDKAESDQIGAADIGGGANAPREYDFSNVVVGDPPPHPRTIHHATASSSHAPLGREQGVSCEEGFHTSHDVHDFGSYPLGTKNNGIGNRAEVQQEVAEDGYTTDHEGVGHESSNLAVNENIMAEQNTFASAASGAPHPPRLLASSPPPPPPPPRFLLTFSSSSTDAPLPLISSPAGFSLPIPFADEILIAGGDLRRRKGRSELLLLDLARLFASEERDWKKKMSSSSEQARKAYAEFEEKVKRTVLLENLSPHVTTSVIKTAVDQFGTAVNVEFIPNYTLPYNIPQAAWSRWRIQSTSIL
uniref:RRM domain-containing protein n=1 Tax=Ananas comosus var. bracteatus TaxID=296719 RepID=A0A6V7Q9I4_ANACO|nr:unnamed protein product [Ananas comosus var. bracteatus]